MPGPFVAAFDRLSRDIPFQAIGDDGGGIRVAGRGPRALILLPGIVGAADALAALADGLDGHTRVAFVTYPRVESLDAMLAWLEQVRARMAGQSRIAVYGGSYGGLVVQAWLRRAPASLGDIVISGTGPPEVARADKNARTLSLVRRAPMAAWRLALRTAVRVTTRRAPDREIWRAFYGRAIDGLAKADLVSRYRVVIDLDRMGPPSFSDLVPWRGRLLVLEGARDGVARERARAALRTTYPQATFHVFDDVGHGMALDRPDEWLHVVSGFLRQAPID